MTDIKTFIQQAIQQLSGDPADNRVDAEVLLMHGLQKSRAFLYAHPEYQLSDQQEQNLAELLTKRQQGVPIAYLTGHQAFWSLPLMVTPDTLIPRPETELLVELTLDNLASLERAAVLDLGTGSGAIALALASERPDWQISACDKCPKALQVAKANALNLGLRNIQFYLSDWFSAIDPSQAFHAIVANPPYIAEGDPHLNVGDVRFEPQSALVSGEQGLVDIELIIKNALAILAPNGLLLIEHGFDQKSAVQSMLIKYGYDLVQTWQDWQGNDRVSGGRRIIVDTSGNF